MTRKAANRRFSTKTVPTAVQKDSDEDSDDVDVFIRPGGSGFLTEEKVKEIVKLMLDESKE